MSTCRSCNAEVRFVKTVGGKTQILDAEPSEKGNVQIVMVGGEEIAQALGPAFRASAQMEGIPLYLDHHATCPNVKDWR